MLAMEENILRILETVKETDIDKRPPLPKIKHNRQAKSALATANKALINVKNRLGTQLSVAEVNATASEVSDTLGIKTKI